MAESRIDKAESRLAGLKETRYSFWLHWRELASYILPRRYRWLVTPNEMKRGAPINTGIIDSTGTIAARVCAAGMMSGITSPTRPWFRLSIEGFALDDTSNAVSLWLAECEKRMFKVFAESNFYNAMATMYLDLIVFGTAVAIIYEDFDDVIRVYTPCAGEYYLENSARMEVDTLYREFTMTVSQVVDEFGLENCSENVRRLHEGPRSGWSREVVVGHCIEPNDDPKRKKWKYRELYWERGQSRETPPLRYTGFREFPVLAPRWDLVSNDAYGRSPAMDALGDIKQLQQETKRKAQAIDKMVNPPMVGDVQLRNQPASLLPGGLTYVAGAQNVGFKPAYQVVPPIQELKEDIREIQERIKVIFFNDLFMMISQLDTVRTATEIDARREEKLVMLGPVLERFEQEALDPAIDRTFGIMMRGGLLPDPPEEVQGRPIQVNYVSMLAEAQRAVSASGMERLAAQVGNLAGVDPQVLDILDFDAFVTEYADLMGVPPKIIRDKESLQQMRDARAKQQQQQALLQQTEAAVKGAQTLSKTDVGGGQNALESMFGAGGSLAEG